jgi:hypothetical protein
MGWEGRSGVGTRSQETPDRHLILKESLVHALDILYAVLRLAHTCLGLLEASPCPRQFLSVYPDCPLFHLGATLFELCGQRQSTSLVAGRLQHVASGQIP